MKRSRSPDGRLIAFTANSAGGTFVINATEATSGGSARSPLPTCPGNPYRREGASEAPTDGE